MLAYYIAAVNIESAYHDQAAAQSPDREYEPFPGLVLADTFQSWEDDDRLDFEVFRENNARLEHLKALPIRVIVGNPPYSVGQESANDNNANESYPTLDRAIRETYAERSAATLKNSLYDSYIRAIKWASQRLADRGMVGYVTNGGWLTSNTADGMRLSLAEEFSAIYVYNLRGNQRTGGEQSRREGGKVFGGGSRATVAITLLVKNSEKSTPATIRYADIGDYLSREQKLAKVRAAGGINGVEFTAIIPNKHGDWLNQRHDDFSSFLALSSDGKEISLVSSRNRGLETGRDAWVYNFSANQLAEAMRVAVTTYAACKAGNMTNDERKIKWTESLRHMLASGRTIEYEKSSPRMAMYRPFQSMRLYPDAAWIHRPKIARDVFPAGGPSNVGFYAIGTGATTDFSLLMTARIPDIQMLGAGQNGQFYPRWSYAAAEGQGALDFGEGEVVDGFRRIDNITDSALDRFRAAYGAKITKDDIFHYVYGLLHSPEYRETYAADLKKMLPRIPLMADLWLFVEAGRALSELHLGYERVEPYPLGGLDTKPVGDPYEFFQVEKMAFGKRRVDGKLTPDKSSIAYNSRITLTDIPEEAYRYMLGSRSGVEWIIDRYQVKKDKASEIVNDPNNWSREVGDPRYIVDLLARIVTVSLETMKLVDSLPPLDVLDPQLK